MDIPVLKINPILCDNTIDVLFCSTALRCRQTAEAFLNYHPVENIFYSDLFLERDLGLLQGKYRTEAIKEYPDIFEKNKLDVFATPPSGESYVHFMQRVVKAMEWIDQNSNGVHNILICSHNQFLKMFFSLLTEKPINNVDWNSLTFPFGEIVPIDLHK